MMAVRLIATTAQNASPTVFCGFKNSLSMHTYVLDLVFPLMLLPVVAVLIRAILTESAMVFVVWIRPPDHCKAFV